LNCLNNAFAHGIHYILNERIIICSLSFPLIHNGAWYLHHRRYALYFSRASIPYDRDGWKTDTSKIKDCYLRHVGIYAYRAGFIKKYIDWAPSALENIESLEQLRVLWYGEKIHVAVAANNPPAGVDTPEDLERVREHVAKLTVEGP